MDEGILMRAVTIGASVFITLATITAVMMYYNTAKIAVTSIGTGTNIEENYRKDIKEILYDKVVTGSDLKNILQYFLNNHEVNITISSYFAYDICGSQIIDIPISFQQNINSEISETYMQIMKTMMPNQKFKLLSNGNEQYIFTLINP